VNELDKNLLTGESIVFETRKHWFAPVRDSIIPVLMILAALAVKSLAPSGENVFGTIGGWLDIAANIAIVVAILWGVLNVAEFLSANFGVTNMRVLRYEGLIRRRSSETLLSMLTDVRLDEPALGRMLGFGDLKILTSSGAAGMDKFQTVARAPELRTAIQEQKAAAMRPAAAPPAPAPPAAPTAPVSPPAAMPEAATTAAPLTAAAADDAAAALARLADMRDQGLITPEDFETKKAEILGRI
jgi:uncharacterized membrane protein YdbT with pleckstrin-like domain